MNEYEKKAKDFLESTGTGLTVEYDQHGKHFPDDKEPRAIFEFTLCRSGKEYVGTFGQSIAAGDKKPSAYDILSCLDYWDGTFSDFCEDFGYSTDSITARKTYTRVMDQSRGLKSLFSPEELDKLGDIQ